MTYLTCTCCGLVVYARANYLPLEHCPRCLARERTAPPMRISEYPPNRPEPRAQRTVAETDSPRVR
jgi:hypothetical protein